MKGDFTRSTFRIEKHYSSVRMQQGRVQLDADWNEQADITAHRVETATHDVIGACGAPLHEAGFGLSGGTMPKISAGRYYVDGILCENEQEVALNQQPDLPGYTPPAGAGFYIAYLDVWQRHITALEDDTIREVALGGPDTATRSKTVWQVKLVGPLPGPLNCLSDPQPWQDAIKPSTGQLRARSQPGGPSDDECAVPPGAGYRRLENQLYRVEIHQAGNRGAAKFKWSRDNGSVVTRWLDQSGNDLTVSSIGRDKVLGFAGGQTVELIDDTCELKGEAGTLVRLSNAEGQVLTLDSTDPATATINRSNFDQGAKVRRWDSDGLLTTGAGWIPLEDGVEVTFEPGFYNVGDYWLIPARTAKGDVEWPTDTATPPQPLPQPPAGIRHHFCRLAILERDAAGFDVAEDCRSLFPPLTEVVSFHYIGGDGQEAMPGHPLPQLLQVAVMNGRQPVEHARVRFAASETGGRVAQNHAGLSGSASNTIDVQTGSDGVASVAWRLEADVTKPSQTLSATLLDSAGNPTSHPPIRFSANLSLASQIYYDPAKCGALGSDITNVQDAIDALCAIKSEGGCCCVTVGEGGQFPSIDEALAALGEVDHLCICLMPGEQPPSDGVQFAVNPKERTVHLAIRGCSGARLTLNKPWSFSGLATFLMEDVQVVVPDLLNVDGFVRFDDCGQVSLTSCALVARGEEGILLVLGRTQRVHFEGNMVSVLLESSLVFATPLFEGTAAAGLFDVAPRLEFARAALVSAEALRSMSARDRRELAVRIDEFVTAHSEMSEVEATGFATLAGTLRRSAREFTAEALAGELIAARDRLVLTRPGVALVIRDAGADAILEGNDVVGIVSLYGPPSGQKVSLDSLREMLENFFKQAQTGKVKFTGKQRGFLQMRGNTLGQVVVGDGLIKQIAKLSAEGGELTGLYRSAFVTDNLFETGDNLLSAAHLALSSNHFDPASGFLMAAAIGETGVYLGNRGPHSDASLLDITLESEQAANVNLNVFHP